MFQDRLFTLDHLLPLPAVGLGDFVEGCALIGIKFRAAALQPALLTGVTSPRKP